MINKNNMVLLEGNLVRDPEIHTLGNGSQVVHFTIAINGAGSSAEEKSKAGFFDCKIWLTANDYCAAADVTAAREGFTNEWKQGTRLSVIGRLSQESWKKDGNTLSKIVVMCDKVQGNTYKANTGAPGAERAAMTEAPAPAQAIPQSF